MEKYSSIPKWSEDYFGKYIFAFDKIDGSNFRAEWNRKLSKKSRFTFGFSKFGTREEKIKNVNHPFYEAVEIFQNKFSEQLNEIFLTDKTFRNVDSITVYGEFFGLNSFAGLHDWKEEHDIKIFDVLLNKKGFLPPSDFIKIFADIDTCQFLFSGFFSEKEVQVVENNLLNLQEGIVCKGAEDKEVFMFKIKTIDWLEKVKKLYGDDRTDY